MPRTSDSSGSSDTDTSSYTDTTTTTTASDFDERRRRRGRQQQRYSTGMPYGPPPGMGYMMPGMTHPGAMGHPAAGHPHPHHHHHHHHPQHVSFPGLPPGSNAGLAAGGLLAGQSELTADTGTTEAAARERARVLLLEFRETKAALAGAQKALEQSQAENERLNDVLYQQRTLFNSERAEHEAAREAASRAHAAALDTVPEGVRAAAEAASASLVEANRARVEAEEDLRRALQEKEEGEKSHRDLERLYHMQDSEVQVLREAVEAEKERGAQAVTHVEQTCSERLRAAEDGRFREIDLENGRVISELMRERDGLRQQVADAEAAARQPDVNAELTIARLTTEIGGLRQQLADSASEVRALRLQVAAPPPPPPPPPSPPLLAASQPGAGGGVQENPLVSELRAMRMELRSTAGTHVSTAAGGGTAPPPSEPPLSQPPLSQPPSQAAAAAAVDVAERAFFVGELRTLRRDLDEAKGQAGAAAEEAARLQRDLLRAERLLAAAQEQQQPADRGTELLARELQAMRQEGDEAAARRRGEREAERRSAAAVAEEVAVLRDEVLAARQQQQQQQLLQTEQQQQQQQRLEELQEAQQQQAAAAAATPIVPAPAAPAEEAATLRTENAALRDELQASAEARRALQSAAAAARLHRQADANAAQEATQLRARLGEAEVRAAAAEAARDGETQHTTREKQRHAQTKGRLAALAREHDVVLSALEEARSEAERLRREEKKGRRSAEEMREQNAALRQQGELFKEKIHESERQRRDTELQRDALGLAVRQASDRQFVQERRLEEQQVEKAVLHDILTQKTAAAAASPPQSVRRGGGGAGGVSLEDKYLKLEGKLDLLLATTANAQQPTHQQRSATLPPPEDSPGRGAPAGGYPFDDGDDTQAEEAAAEHAAEQEAIVRLATQLTSRDRELATMRREMDGLRRVVEDGGGAAPAAGAPTGGGGRQRAATGGGLSRAAFDAAHIVPPRRRYPSPPGFGAGGGTVSGPL